MSTYEVTVGSAVTYEVETGGDTYNVRLYSAVIGTDASSAAGVFNLLDYGAVGDGVVDDTTAAQACLTAAVSYGDARVVVSPGKTFMVDYLTVSGPMKITGGGTIKSTKDADEPVIKVRSSGVVIDGITIDADNYVTPYSGATVTQRSCIEVYSGVYNAISVQNCTLKNAGRDAVYINSVGGVDFRIENNKMESITRNPVSIIAGSDIHVTGNKIKNWGLVGIDLEPNNATDYIFDVEIIGNTLDNSSNSADTSGAIQPTVGSSGATSGFYNVVIIGNTCKHYAASTTRTSSSIRNNGFDEVTIIGNHIYNSLVGISAGSSTVFGNKIYGTNSYSKVESSLYAAINVDSGAVVSANTIDGAGYHGVVVPDGKTDVIVSGNKIQNCGTNSGHYGIYIYNGTRCTVSSNSITSSQNGIYWRTSATDCEMFGNQVSTTGNDHYGASPLNRSAPASPVEGVFYYDSTANKLKVYNGSSWETISSS